MRSTKAAEPIPRPVLVVVLCLLALSGLLGCGLTGVVSQRNHAIRRAVVAHELATGGTVQELLVDCGMVESRANLGYEDGNTIWLNPAARSEYFERMNPNLSYLYLHTPRVDSDQAVIRVERGVGKETVSRNLSLEYTGTKWVVVGDESASPD